MNEATELLLSTMEESIWECLDIREQITIICRYGLDGNEPQGLKYIGEHYFNVGYMRTRHFHNMAFSKMRRYINNP